MDIIPMKESIKLFFKNNKENIGKKYTEEKIRIALSLFDEYSTYFDENGFFITPINVIKAKEDVNEKAQEAKNNETQSDNSEQQDEKKSDEKKSDEKKSDEKKSDEDDDINTLFD